MDSSLDIVVIEDHELLRRVTTQLLESNGHRVIGVAAAEEIDDLTGFQAPDLYLVDLNLPGEDGLSLSKRLRTAQPGVGIIMITARSELNDRLDGYNHGADLYLAKPVDPAELIAAIAALTRRLRSRGVQTCSLDARNHRVRGPVGEETLQYHEVSVLSALARAPGQTLELWQIAQHLGQPEESFSKASMEVRIARLRRKLVTVSGVENPIRSVRKIGYRLCMPLSID